MTLLTGELLVFGVLAVLVLGAVVYALKFKNKGSSELDLPMKWPLTSRALVGSTEEKVWAWLREVFPDHQVMVKIPVLRFTTLLEKEKEKNNANPKAKAKTERLLGHLGGVYATFTVCSAAGKVVGCVDVPGKTPQSKASRELKETLLSDCGIAYIVVTPSSLPAGSAMRAAFLNEAPPEESNHDISLLEGVDTTFRADLKSFNVQPVKEKPAPKKVVNKGF